MSWSSAFIRAAVGAPADNTAREFSEISTDSRMLEPGAAFIALSGERYDAHDHLEKARDAGARMAIVREGTPPVPGLELLYVSDPLRAYGLLARAHRRTISGPVVAITGSNGKTSTKEMVAAVLRTRFRTHATRLNLNNLVGIPQTILAAGADTEALVIEAGANMDSEIARAREVIEPSVAIITNVTASHLEGFGSVEGVLREKLALAQGVPLAIVGTEPPELARAVRLIAGRVIVAGLSDADVRPAQLTIGPSGEPAFTIDGESITLPLRGAHQAGNAMLAWALVRELGLDPGAAAAALSGLVLPAGRGELLRVGDLTIVHDAYNANPSSFRAAILTAQAMRAGRRLVFVAGSMRELGEDSAKLHADVAGLLADLKPELLAVVGDFVPAIAPWASGLGERLIAAPDPVALGPLLASRIQGDELIFLKASRGVALERILPYLGVQSGSSH